MKRTVNSHHLIFAFPKEAKLCKVCLNRIGRRCNVYKEKCKKIEECDCYDVSLYQLQKSLLRTMKYK